MSGAQPKAGTIAGCITVCAEVNPKAVSVRHSQGWVNEVITDIEILVQRVQQAKAANQAVSFAYQGNVVTVWEKFHEANIYIDIGSDQTSLHNPFAGGYYPAQLSFEKANEMMAAHPAEFKKYVQESLRRQVEAINRHTAKGTYFFDYGNAFLLEAARAGAAIYRTAGGKMAPAAMAGAAAQWAYPSYVQDIMGPLCFDYGFGPFRWVCASGKDADLQLTDGIAQQVLEELMQQAPGEIRQQLADNLHWIRSAQHNQLVVGSKARILYADAEGRIKIARAFNEAIRKGKIGPVILGRDHHDVSGTDSPYRETSNIYDGSRYTADMAVQNVIGDSFRGATWVSLHNGGGVGWGEAINGGFGMVIDGSKEADKHIEAMLFWDVTNGIARRSWAQNQGALFTAKRTMNARSDLQITLPNAVDGALLDTIQLS